MESNSKPALKRKRYEPPEEELNIRISGKLHHEKKEVHKAAKRAKVFETQKVVKRLKNIRQKDEKYKAIESLEGELTSLKEIDYDAIGNSAFRNKLLKDHTLRDNEDVKNAVAKELENGIFVASERGTTLAKIQSRLLSSKILATQVMASLNAIKAVLDPALKQREKTTDVDVTLNSHTEGKPSKIRKTSLSAGTNRPLLASVDTADVQFDVVEDDAGWESGSVDISVAALADDGWESGSIDGGGQGDEDDSNQVSFSDEDSDSDNEDLKVKSNQVKTKAPASNLPKNSSSKSESTFLPSLAVGFVRGSDESDWSETEGKAADMLKKNRRGQRARRAIWEKKFGRNANHKKKEAAENAAAQLRRNKGRTTNSGPNAIHSRDVHVPAVINKGGKTALLQERPIDAGWGGRSERASVNKPSESKADKKSEKALHPSWEAKRRLKEKERVGIVPGQGTKIKFS
ncbi:Bud-site selection protein [Gymnopilus junonius]|uniref:Bud-site selection protein n=1 Tax=Gymnopilus junonius TaxID=109634 RepID=A0A9P5NW60_GYMJU|nr:Bud-site selection protein [Gymnopilus junonius]